METREIIHALAEIEALKFGEFTLKSGIISPFYLDLRLIISFPKLLQGISTAIWRLIRNVPFDRICGVPYTALPIATAISINQNKPMILKRKETKDYGTKKTIEGVYNPGEKCLIIEDVITSGTSILETVGPLKTEGLIITDIAVVVDREQGAQDRLKTEGYKLHTLMTITQIINTLKETGHLSNAKAEEITQWLK